MPPPPARVLDAGCGDGRISAELVKRGYSVIGVDCLQTAVMYAQSLVPEARFFVADLRKSLLATLRVGQGHFDAVLMVEVYEHIAPNYCPDVLGNIFTVLRPGGTFIITVPSKHLPPSNLHYRHFHWDEFKKELEVAGFRINRLICQHRIDRMTGWLLCDTVERFLNNRWLQPVFLKRLRRRFYMKYANVVNDQRRCGRFIAVAERCAE